MEIADVPRHRPLAFDKMESLIKEMQDPETGVPVRSQKLFLSVIPSAFMGYDLVEWLMDRFNLDETSNVEAINLANQLCQYGYFFPVNDLKNLVLKDDSSLYRFQSPYYWPWQSTRIGGSGSSAPALGPDNVEYAIYLVKRTLRNKQRHALEDYEQEALANLKKNLAAKWDFITMQAEEQVRVSKERKKGDKIVSDSQERAYWRVARPPPGAPSALEPCPVPVRTRHQRPKKRTIDHLKREVEFLKASLDRTRVKTSIALEALVAYSETFAPYDPWLTPPQPSNPWISDDTLFWQINSPLVEVPSEKRVQRWALSIEELVSDPTGLQEFTSFLRKEYSHENIRFWLAVMDLRRSSTKQIPKKLEEIYEEFLKPGAPCEINIDGATAEKVAEGLRSGSRYALDHAADHVYGLLLKKDCYPRFIRSDHFQRLLAEGRNVYQKKAKFFNFGGQVKKKPNAGSGSGGGSGLSRRRGSDRSLSGSAHELAVCAAQPPRAPDPPPHSHSQSNLCEIPFRDPLDDSVDEALPWESTSRDVVYGARRRQDSAADSGSSSSDVSAAVQCGERARRLPQQSTLDGGLRGAPPPLRRLSAVEPRHLAPLGSPPHSPRRTRPAAAPIVPAHVPPHPTPTISVSSAPDDELAGSPPAPSSPEDKRSLAHSDEPSSVFASVEHTPSEPARPFAPAPPAADSGTEEVTTAETTERLPPCPSPADEACADSSGVRSVSRTSTLRSSSRESTARSESRESDRTRSFEEDVVSVRRPLSREPSTTRETTPVATKDSRIGDLPGNAAQTSSEMRLKSERAPMRGLSVSPSTSTAEAPTEVARPPETSQLAEVSRPTETVRSAEAIRSAEASQLSEVQQSAEPARPGVAPRPAEAPRLAEGSRPVEAARSVEVMRPAEAPRPLAPSPPVPPAPAAPPAVAPPAAAPALPTPRPVVAPLAVGEDIGVDDDTVDKVPSTPLQRISEDSRVVSESGASKPIAHEDGPSSVSESDVVKGDSKSEVGERKQRNDICPWEDENSCESDAPFVKTYATLGYL